MNYFYVSLRRFNIGKKPFFDAPAMPGMGFLQKVN
jgi:hypothetical protein